jgi:hypothetical protein
MEVVEVEILMRVIEDWRVELVLLRWLMRKKEKKN